MAQDYQKRLFIPINGVDNILFYTKSNLLIAKGYVRVVIGQRGPYIEFLKNQIVKENLFLPEDKRWKLNNSNVQYLEYRTICKSNVKIYYQTKTVDYADYKIGFIYISPFDLISDEYPILIAPLERKKKI